MLTKQHLNYFTEKQFMVFQLTVNNGMQMKGMDSNNYKTIIIFK